MDPEVKGLIDQIGREYTELQHTLKLKAEQAAQGVVDPLVEAKLKALSAGLAEQEAKKDKALAELKSRVDALAFAGERTVEGGSPELREYRKKLEGYVRRGDEAGLRELERRALSVGNDPDGGYTVEADKNGRVVSRIYETSPVRQHASVVSISTDSLEGLIDNGEAQASWVGETGARNETNTPQLGSWRIVVHELFAKPRATQKLLDDSAVDIEAWLLGKIADQFARSQNTAFVTGNGVARPRGFATYATATTADASRAWGTFQHVGTGASGSFGTDPNGVDRLLQVKHALNPAYLGNAKWFMNRTTLAELRTLTDASANGGYVFVPDWSGQTPGTILGNPIVLFEDMATYTTGSSLAIAYGDMREAYQIVDRIGVRVLRDPYSAKPYVEFYATTRVGGDVVNFNALKFVLFA